MRSDDSSKPSPPAWTPPPADRPLSHYYLRLDDGTQVPADLTPAQVNWLKAAGCIQTGSLPPMPAADSNFTPTRALWFTEIGTALVGAYFEGTPPSASPQFHAMQMVAAVQLMAERPIWIKRQGRLWYRGELLKWYDKIAENQFLILDAFQACGWQCRLAVNPLAKLIEEYGSGQLHDTLRALNTGQKPRRVKFRLEHTGQLRLETRPNAP